MFCRLQRQQISAYLDGELKPSAAKRLEEHLARCSACAAVLRQYQQLHIGLAAAPRPESQPESWGRLQTEAARRALLPTPASPEQVAGKGPRQPWWQPLQRRVLVPGGALVAVFLGLLLGQYLRSQPILTWQEASLPGAATEASRVPRGEQRDTKGGPEFQRKTDQQILTAHQGISSQLSGGNVAPFNRVRGEGRKPVVRVLKAPRGLAPEPSPPPPQDTASWAALPASLPAREGSGKNRNRPDLSSPAASPARTAREAVIAPQPLSPPAPAEPADPLSGSGLAALPLTALFTFTPSTFLSAAGVDYHMVADSPSGRFERRLISDATRGILIETEEEERTTDGLEIVSASLTISETQPIPDPETGQLTLVTTHRPTTVMRIAEVGLHP